MRNALRRRYRRSAVTPKEILNEIAPPYDIGGLIVRDARATRRITLADLKGDMRLPRDGKHRVELVAAFRHYDGGLTDGEGSGNYANLFLAWRAGTATWRSSGVRILPFEAERIARAVERGTGSRPGGEEPDRIGGTGAVTELRAAAVGDSVLIFVKFGKGPYFRSRGVEILASERPTIADGLRSFAKMRGRAK